MNVFIFVKSICFFDNPVVIFISAYLLVVTLSLKVIMLTEKITFSIFQLVHQIFIKYTFPFLNFIALSLKVLTKKLTENFFYTLTTIQDVMDAYVF